MQYEQSITVGPTNQPSCPYCNNSFQNTSPADRPDLLRCATCKKIFEPHIPICHLCSKAMKECEYTDCPEFIQEFGPFPTKHYYTCDCRS